ncbi:hypothetical protein DSO57_1008798 [Entomophthora muscae]|uniref:Uncharacterized protein n=1 Tax=Entomophthora muscae TaxID=34485 RepID=A0ACC2US90_9FUNG|nr:hypothetical protein DSO57_1008798 [Entomophthora muscae]
MGDLINIGVTIVEVRSLANWKFPVISKGDVYTAVKVSTQQNKTKSDTDCKELCHVERDVPLRRQPG